MNKYVGFAIFANLVSVICFSLAGEATTALAHIQCLLWLDVIRRDNNLIDDLWKFFERHKGE